MLLYPEGIIVLNETAHEIASHCDGRSVNEIIQTLESTGVPGYTEMPKMVGRGRHTRHFDNSVWPGATGCAFTVLSPSEARQRLLPTFESLAANLETRSHGLYGLHIFALPCEQLI